MADPELTPDSPYSVLCGAPYRWSIIHLAPLENPGSAPGTMLREKTEKCLDYKRAYTIPIYYDVEEEGKHVHIDDRLQKTVPVEL